MKPRLSCRPPPLPARPVSPLHQLELPGDDCPISDLDIKDAIALESAQRPLPYRRQSVLDPALQESPVFGGRKSTLLRDWVISRTAEISYERKLKSLMEKGTEPKVELVRMLKPEEVLSCR